MHDKLLPNLCTNVYNLKLWVMTLFGVKLFLRGDETITLRYEDIANELVVMNHNGTIKCLPMNTLWKEEDDAPTTLAIWHGKHIPHMDLMRKFLLLTHITGLKNGHIFSNVMDLKKTCKDDVVTHNSVHLSYGVFLVTLRHVCIWFLTENAK